MKHDWQLTPRELKTLKYLRDGLSNKEIATKMGIAYRTVKHHTASIYRKFGVPDRLALHKVVGFHTKRRS